MADQHNGGDWKIWVIGVLMTITLALSGYAWRNTVQSIDELRVQTEQNSRLSTQLSAQLWQQNIFQCLKTEKVKAALSNDYDRRLAQSRAFKPTHDLPKSLIQQSIRNLETILRDLKPESCELPFPGVE